MMIPEEKKARLEEYIARATPLPTLPQVVTQVLRLCENPDSKIEKIADSILEDQVLAARMIRLINSAFWGLQKEVSSIRETIVLLGLHRIRSIVLTTSLFNTFQSRNSLFRISSIWEHGLGCAMLSQRIARIIGYPDLEKAYLAGLLHDIGEVILSQYCDEAFDRVIDLVHKECISFYDAENAILGINHTDFGPWFAEHWGFSEALTEVITTHHECEKAAVDPLLVSIVVLADLFCRVRGLDYGFWESVQVSFKDEAAWRILSEKNSALDRIDLERFTFNIDGMVEEVKKTVNDVYGNGAR